MGIERQGLNSCCYGDETFPTLPDLYSVNILVCAKFTFDCSKPSLVTQASTAPERLFKKISNL